MRGLCPVQTRPLRRGFVGSDYEFIPMVFEATGGINNEGYTFFAKLLLAARNFQSDPHSVHMGRGWQALSCVLQSSVAQMVVNRLDLDSDSD